MIKEIARLHCLTVDLNNKSHLRQAEDFCRGGAEWIQYRAKNKPSAQWIEEAKAMRALTNQYKAKLIVNDNPEVALSVKADGVHLGKEDIPILQARAILGSNAIIGGTANTLGDVMKLVNEGADYIGLGPYRFTETKSKLSPILTGDFLRKIGRLDLPIPIVLIGGIRLSDVLEIMESGFHGIAVSSAISSAKDPITATNSFIEEIKNYQCQQVE